MCSNLKIKIRGILTPNLKIKRFLFRTRRLASCGRITDVSSFSSGDSDDLTVGWRREKLGLNFKTFLNFFIK